MQTQSSSTPHHVGFRARPDWVVKVCKLANGAERREHYDFGGRLQRVDEPDGSSLVYRYGAGGALQGLEHSSGERVRFVREADEMRATTAGSETRVRFDANGMPRSLSLRVGEHCWTLEYVRSPRGQVLAMRYPQSTAPLQLGAALQCGERCYARGEPPYLRFENGASACEEWVGGDKPELRRIAHFDASGAAAIEQHYEHGENGQLARAGTQRFTYDEAGRLLTCNERQYAFDAAGRMTRAGQSQLAYAGTPAVAVLRIGGTGRNEPREDATSREPRDAANSRDPREATSDRELREPARDLTSRTSEPHTRDDAAIDPARAGNVRFDYDALGRRSSRTDAHGATRYAYNLFGQLAEVTLPDARRVRYHYDGFGRMIGREHDGVTVYYVVDFEGRRIAECAADGGVTRSYLWLGMQCVGAVDGSCGQPLTQSYHRVHGGTLVAIGDATGNLTPIEAADPYGSDAPIVHGIPGFAGLFGDPDTGLLLASTRWLDPQIAQFITPDSWHGTHALERLPGGMRSVLDRLPGGTGGRLDAQTAYTFCSYDPVNQCDPSGHSVMGIIWSLISAFLWEMQVTSIALQMEVISLVAFILLTIPGFMFLWGTKGWKRINPFNAIAPLLGSSRLNVPFAFPLNSIWNASGAVFTMGNVIWVNGEQMDTLETTAQRDLLTCSNGSSYVTAVEAVAADAYRVRSPHARGTGTSNAAGTQVDAVSVTAPAGAGTTDVFSTSDWLSLRLASEPNGADELRQISTVAATSLGLRSALPARLQGKALAFARTDFGIVKIAQAESTIARTLAYVRGNALHFQNQIPESIPTSGLSVSEYLRSGKPRTTSADCPREALLLRLPAAADQPLYAAGDFVRVRAGTSYFARVVARKRASRDLVLETPLPAPAAPNDYVKVEVVNLAPGAVAANQTASGTQLTAGNLTDLRKLDGVAVTNTGAGTLTTERRIVTQVLLRCGISALPADLQAKPISVDLMAPDTSVQATGKISGADQITTIAGQASRFSAGQPLRLRKAPSSDFFTTVRSVEAATNKITLTDSPPAAAFANGTAVTAVLLIGSRRLEAQPSAAPHTDVLIKVVEPTSPVQNDVLRVRDATAADGGVLRQISSVPSVVVTLDSALPASHTTALAVRRFRPLANTLRDSAAAPLVQLRVTIHGTSNPYVQNDELHLRQGEEAYGKVLAAPSGQQLLLVDPIEIALGDTGIDVEHITPTGKATPDAKLEESLILIPSDLDEPPITRRRAVESHEMRHVWQYSVLGPFFFSMPLPWLAHLGYSVSDSPNSKWARHVSVGAVDSLIAAVAWGIGTGGRGPTDLAGEVTDAGRKLIQFPAATPVERFKDFESGSPCDVVIGDYDTFNIVESVDTGTKALTLRFALEPDKFAVGAKIKVSVSPFENIRSTVNKWFSLNLERLWSDHIPQAWGRALSKFLNRDSWVPLLGLYPIGFMLAKRNQGRMHFEQDASYHSGDLYTNLAVSSQNDIFVGQFTRLMAFIRGRGAGDTAVGFADENPLDYLTVETPSITGVASTEMVAGAVDAGASRVRFRENYYIPMLDKVENALGAWFSASRAGDYVVHINGELTDDVVHTVSFSADFLELRKIKVKSLTVTPAVSPAKPLFETQRVPFAIAGDNSADYRLRYKGTPPAAAGTFDRLRFTVPLLPSAAVATHTLEITATYAATHPVFSGSGQNGAARLTAEQRTNVCQELVLTIAPLVVPSIGPVRAGSSTPFTLPIAPASVRVTSAKPAGAAVNASVLNGTGDPVQLKFIAPNAVTAATDVTFDLVFGAGAVTKTLHVTVHVTP